MGDSSPIDDPRALGDKRAAKLARVTMSQLRYWEETDLIAPSISRRFSERSAVRLYDFDRLLELLIVAELRSRRFSLQHIRAVLHHLRRRGYQDPLTEIRFATVGGRIYFQLEDGTWEGLERPNQIVLHEVLDLVPLKARIKQAFARPAASRGRVERRRGRLGFKPVIAGTRIPVATVRSWLDEGASLEDVQAAYPELTKADIKRVLDQSQAV